MISPVLPIVPQSMLYHISVLTIAFKELFEKRRLTGQNRSEHNEIHKSTTLMVEDQAKDLTEEEIRVLIGKLERKG